MILMMLWQIFPWNEGSDPDDDQRHVQQRTG